MLMIRQGLADNGPGDEVPVTINDWKQFATASREKIQQLRAVVEDLRSQGKTVAGYGASAKSTVWINACPLTEKHLSCIFDNTPQKVGKYSPGSNIPIAHEADLLQLMPDYCILFAWNFREDCIAKNQEYLQAGGHFIIPSPDLEIV